MTAASTAASMTKITLALEPLDVLFFRDGRPFGEATRARSGLPTPQVLSGAIRTWLLRQHGCDFRKLDEAVRGGAPLEEAFAASCGAGWIARVRVRGPWLARRSSRSDGLEVLVPAPATLHRPKRSSQQGPRCHDPKAGSSKQRPGTLFCLAPLGPHQSLPGWKPLINEMRPLWLKSPVHTERVAGYLTPQGLKRLLDGGLPEDSEDDEQSDLVKPDKLFAFDLRTGIVVDADRLTAAEHMLYAASFLAMKPWVEFLAEVILPPEVPATLFAGQITLPFGGERRQVRARDVTKTTPIQWPKPSVPADGRTLVMLTTPGIFKDGWRPECFKEGNLVAAAVPGYEAVSGWDLARGGPKRTRFAVPAGSVYFLEGPLPPMPDESLADDPDDRLQGWGCFVTGTWDYA